jgi:GDP-L-fucose synthase
MALMAPDARIFVAGHRGLVGSGIVRQLRARGFSRLLLAGRDELDLRDQSSVQRWFHQREPEFVFLAAGTVGGILANASRPAEFLYDNLAIAANVVEASHVCRVRKLLYLSSGCIYPRDAAQPIPETGLLTGPLEPTNEAYGIAKIAGIGLCRSYRRQYEADFISVVPASVYGPGDNFDLADAHVVPALIRKFHEARVRGSREVTVWGSGEARREFLHADDLADACLFLMERYSDAMHINVGTGEDLTIGALADAVREVVYPDASIAFDTSKPDGMPRRRLDVARLHALGWRHRIELRDGLASTYRWYAERVNNHVTCPPLIS